MDILVACEYSGAVREAFKKKGHNAWSCDLLSAEDNSRFHLQTDCRVAILEGWDLIIMHPPCTYLAVSGNRWYGTGMPGHDKRLEALEWTRNLWQLALFYAPKVALENPVGVLSNCPELPKPQYIQPWMFGHGETKKTGLWLHNLPPLEPTNIVEGREQRVWKMPPSEDRWKERSRTYDGIAEAMAAQWS
jgi:hypothetical protein